MKVISTLATTAIALGVVNAESEHVQRELVLGGTAVPVGSKTYTTGLRTTAGGESFCGGSLITPTHVLTSASCTRITETAFVSVGTHYINGTSDGEQIKVVKAQNHTDYNATSIHFDIAVLTLEKASKFAPVKLPAANDSDIVPGMWSKVLGWGDTSYPNGTRSHELMGVSLEVWANEECSNIFFVDETMVCAGGAAGKDSCNADNGGPLIKENGRGDADDVLIGIPSWGSGCGDEGIPAVYSRVSAAMEWINWVIKTQ